MDRLLHHERIHKFSETGNLKHICKNGLDKVSFAYDTANSDGKDLAKRITSDKILKYRTYEIAITPKYDDYQRGLASMVYKFFDKKAGSRAKATRKPGASVNEDLPQELRKPVIKNSKEGESMRDLEVKLGRRFS